MKKSNVYIHYPYNTFAPRDVLKNIKPFWLVPIIWYFNYYSHQKEERVPIHTSTPLSHILLVAKLGFTVVLSTRSLTHTTTVILVY
jgi:hypothetical protein